ncbi:nitrate ABC transporter substrate-binding protein [Pigmentiphaga sp. NML080357]|uniref:ABC transporter substrate-binding protein n=1 Tax=Pigmentiphaga sp. NML080357 TaxID=2008675 RepID=UPI000B40D58F|nr:ABC transporter substrate-binding protein [Pigmentiphaga sp. NML080357]OVZ60587.1 nitrate ABC transporter substrate-binding protein [Pigmentiphaga sp. NML080357]
MKLLSVARTVACIATLAVMSPQAGAEKLREVTYLLPAPPSLPAFAPWMIAQQKGYYSEEGLKVSFVVGKGGADVAKQVGAGNAPLGGGVGDTPIIVRPNGVPVKAVAVLGGASLMHLAINRAEVPGSIPGLKGKTIGAMSYADTTYYALLGILRANGLSKSSVDIQASGPSVWQLFAEQKIPALASVPEWTVSAQDAGVKVEVIPADRYFKSMAQAILASDETVKKDPELIRKFVRATLRGLADIVRDPAAATSDYVKAVPGYQGREKYVESVLKLYNATVYQGQPRLGAIDPERVATLQKFYLNEGIIARAVPLGDLFTNDFVPAQ